MYRRCLTFYRMHAQAPSAPAHTYARPHIRTHTQVHTHTHVRTSTRTRTHTHTHVRTHARIRTYAHARTHTQVSTRTCAHASIHTHVRTRTYSHASTHVGRTHVLTCRRQARMIYAINQLAVFFWTRVPSHVLALQDAGDDHVRHAALVLVPVGPVLGLAHLVVAEGAVRQQGEQVGRVEVPGNTYQYTRARGIQKYHKTRNAEQHSSTSTSTSSTSASTSTSNRG